MLTRFNYWLLVLLLISCAEDDATESSGMAETTFQEPILVEVTNYEGDLMEPFLSRDGTVLFFNNLNSPEVNTNLHWASYVNDTVFLYNGELGNINTTSLEGVPTMDENESFYFVFTGTYDQTLSTIYKGAFTNGIISNISLVEDISLKLPGWINFDVEISSDGNTMYFVDGRFDENGGPYESNLVIAQKENSDFSRTERSEEFLININSNDLEYAAAISKNELELCFTRVEAPLGRNSQPRLYIAQRATKNDPFEEAVLLDNITGFVEGPTFSPDDQGIYFHRKVDGVFRIFYSRKSF